MPVILKPFNEFLVFMLKGTAFFLVDFHSDIEQMTTNSCIDLF